jgi:hypothetical protein
MVNADPACEINFGIGCFGGKMCGQTERLAY